MSRTKSYEPVLRSRKRKKVRAVEYLGGKCALCGYYKCVEALEFHHTDMREKDQKPSGLIMSHSWEKILPEIQKCVLLCANCHREVHTVNHGINLDLQTRQKEILFKRCPTCKVDFSTKEESQLYCSVMCSDLGRRKVIRPTKDTLEELIKCKSWSEIGRMFGVSYNTIKKWATKYNLPSRTKDIVR